MVEGWGLRRKLLPFGSEKDDGGGLRILPTIWYDGNGEEKGKLGGHGENREQERERAMA